MNLTESPFFKRIASLSLRRKVNYIGIFIILIFSGIIFIKVLPLLEQGKLEERRGKLRAVVNSVTSLVDHYERGLRQKSWMTDPKEPKTIEEAKEIIIRNLRYMRYDKTEYFFILDGKGKMIMHPLKPELEGTYMMDMKDPNGNLIFKDMVLESQRDSETFVSYIWQSKYSPIIFEPQTTYAKYYWAWDWVICSGVYTQDILDSTREINYLSAGYVVFTTALTIAILLIFVYFNLTRPITNLLQGIEEIKKDNLDHQVKASFNDELGHITHQFNQMIEHRKRTQNELEELNSSLEEKVITRTSELQLTLQEVQELKVKQDGDYFLTSLLLTPFQTKNPEEKPGNIKSDFFIRQYKQFTFRKWSAELGGDVCITENIEINGREYLFFVNADAMGKSIQGAGGAIIFGASIKASLIRTKLGKTVNLLPEIWLRNLYFDLDQLFTTFDGSMLISAIMGLIDEESGVVYYLNAEHPWLVLYRDGVASFVDQEFSLRKIGTPEKNQNNLHIKMFKLEDGDELLVGSDGRDDIILHDTNDVNNDETLFLRSVEKGKGDIDRIMDSINANGKLKDDISLLSMIYTKGSKKVDETLTEDERKVLVKAIKLSRVNRLSEAYELMKQNFQAKAFNPSVFRVLKRICLLDKNFIEYSRILMSYHSINPENTKNLLKISKSLVLCNLLDMSADYAEALRLREPNNTDSLMHLARLYKKMGYLQVALKRAEEAMRVNPENEETTQLYNSILELYEKEKVNESKPNNNLIHSI